MGVTGIVIFQKALQAALKVLGTGKAATGQKATMQHAKEQLGLIEPRAVFRRERKDMPVAWVAQNARRCTPFLSLSGAKGTLHHCATKRQTSRLQWVFKLSSTQS